MHEIVVRDVSTTTIQNDIGINGLPGCINYLDIIVGSKRAKINRLAIPMNSIPAVVGLLLTACAGFQSSASAQVLLAAPPLKESTVLVTESNPVVQVARPLSFPEEQLEKEGDSASTTSNLLGAAEKSSTRTEVVRRRYKTGATESEQEVTVNDRGEQEAHGTFRMWAPQGQLVAQGQFTRGNPSGPWERVYYAENAQKLLSTDQGNFELPLISEFTFVDGKLHGEWHISDASGRRLRTWSFQRGALHGEVVVYYSSGSRMRDAYYDSGVPVQTHREWTADGTLTESHTFEHGRLSAETVHHWSNGTPRAKGTLLHPRYRLTSEPDWWNGEVRIQASEPIGEPVKVGDWIYYHPNGATAQSGTYVRGESEGLFSWWYPHGQLQARGHFRSGQPDGEWTWWHPGGQKQTSGQYAMGEQTGPWTDWDATGRPTASFEHSRNLEPSKSTTVPSNEPIERRGIKRQRINIPLTADGDSHRNLQVQPAETLRR